MSNAYSLYSTRTSLFANVFDKNVLISRLQIG